MQITNDILSKTINNLKGLFLSKKLILLKYYNRIIVSMLKSDPNAILKLNKTLFDFKTVLDKTNDCINNCDILLELLKSDSENSEKFDKLFNNIIDFSSSIDAFIESNLLKKERHLNEPEDLTIDLKNDKVLENKELKTVNKKEDETPDKTEDSLTDNNVLLVSEKLNKVFLPYKISDLKNTLKKDTSYKNLTELINNKYTIPLQYFQNPVVSRFKEAFSLIKDREKGNVFTAVELGLELAFNYSLNPAIISACKNSDELDIYLACLDENELDKFKLFEIKYEIMPR